MGRKFKTTGAEVEAQFPSPVTVSSRNDSFRTGSSRFSNTALQLSINVLALGLFAVLIVFIQATYTAEWRSQQKQPLYDLLKVDVSTTLAVTRAAQGLLAALTYAALKDAFIFLQWTLMNAPGGISYLSLLALSPTTGNLGTFALLRSFEIEAGPKLWALLRVVLTIILWFSGLVLFFNTSMVTVYDTAETYNVTAGVGPFNGSLVQPFREFLRSLSPQYPYEVLPFTQLASVYILVANPLISTIAQPVRCGSSNCVSYLLSGGLSMVAPWVHQGNPEYPMVRIESAPSVQLDFAGPASSNFADEDCDVYGQEGIAIGIRICVREEQPNSGVLRAGLFACTNGTDGGSCHSLTPGMAPNITTRVSFYTREATVVAARSNYTIVSVEETTNPIPFTAIDVPAYRNALSWLLNFTAANIPAPSSIAQSFWSSGDQLQNPTTYGILSQNFQSILTFPFWLFQANNWGNTALKANEIIDSLPPQFYTTASIVTPYTKIKFNWIMFAIFLSLQGLTMLFIWGVLVWVWVGSGGMPMTSSYPIFDVAFKSRVYGQRRSDGLMDADSYEVVHVMREARVVVKVD